VPTAASPFVAKGSQPVALPTKGRRAPLEPGPLTPERYRLPGFSPPLVLDVHVAGWNAELVRPPTWVMLDRAGVNLHLQRWQTVYDPVADLPPSGPFPRIWPPGSRPIPDCASPPRPP
jgi:hypothetical protein